MHEIEPYIRWNKYYVSHLDEKSPFFGKEYQDRYSEAIYGYYIHPFWDFIGSETLYLKILFAHYEQGYVVIEMLGEWNDTLHNDVMFLKRNIIDPMVKKGINKFILIGENVMNFHGSDDCYYEEWFEDVEEGWIAAVNFREFVVDEWKKYNIDWYINFGGNLEIDNWRTLKPTVFYEKVDQAITRRLAM
ncbi:hypothetical protein R9C00_21345 [Flammeovirgaceae bacterium SG7u.111]|nr:hypothetical protein [Flammeovirgaceae bacterium SG7u.132]WPO34248.1 hypothetical protein R9C00_21345 [Flammeovirgaceae bacterium SG7u.111]